jgi:hypothetical protein
MYDKIKAMGLICPSKTGEPELHNYNKSVYEENYVDDVDIPCNIRHYTLTNIMMT